MLTGSEICLLEENVNIFGQPLDALFSEGREFCLKL